jgi:phosphate/sulfate permease
MVAAVFEFVGAAFLGSATTDTVRKGIVSQKMFASNPEILMVHLLSPSPSQSSAFKIIYIRYLLQPLSYLQQIGMLCAEIATAVWLLTATYFSMPVSTTHSVIGKLTSLSFFSIILM